jgi:hypothetical protein
MQQQQLLPQLITLVGCLLDEYFFPLSLFFEILITIIFSLHNNRKKAEKLAGENVGIFMISFFA